MPLCTHILFGLQFDSSKLFRKALVIAIPFLSFKGMTHLYLLNILITRHKTRNRLLNFFINCISERSALQILCLKDEYVFRFLDFLSYFFL